MADISNYTDIFLSKLPYWFKMKKNPNESVGAAFLNVFGLEYDDMREILEYAFRQTYINQMDINYLNCTYKSNLPSLNDNFEIVQVRSNTIILEEAKDLSDFFNITFDYYHNANNYNRDVYIVDKERNLIYVKKDYDSNDTQKYGKINVKYDNNEEYELELKPHSVWNFFDEIGLLINCPRLEAESNFDYKQRILNVFKYTQSSSKEGLLNAITNELGLRKSKTWKDTSKDFVIADPMVVVNKIKLNGKDIPIEFVKLDKCNNIVLLSKPEYPTECEVSYVCNIELHSLSNHSDSQLQSEILNLDNTATELLINYFNKIHSVSPIVWDKFIWDRGYWDITDSELGGKAFIPNLVDAKIEGFKNYLK